jgi:S-adenosylmethionine decarboxylase
MSKTLVTGTLLGRPIERVEELRALTLRVSELMKFHVCGQVWHQFEPQGATGMLLLAESHCCLHTWPETGEIFVDVFCCSPDFDPQKCIACFESVFEAKGVEWKVQDRR